MIKNLVIIIIIKNIKNKITRKYVKYPFFGR